MVPPDRLPTDPPAPVWDPGRVSLVVLALLAVGAVVTFLGPILKPFLLAVFLYFVTRAAAEALVQWRVPRWLAYPALFVLCVVVGLAVCLFVYGQVLSFQALWKKDYQSDIATLIGRFGVEGKTLQHIFKVSSDDVYEFVFHQSVGFIELVVMTFFYLLFLILGGRKVKERVARAFPGETAQRTLAIGEKIGTGMERFMRVKTLVSLGMALTSALLMYLFGLKHWALWAFLFFALNYVTYIGSILACVPPVILAYLDLDSPVTATILGALIVLNRFVWIDWVEIRMSGKHLNIDSALLFLWLAYWGWMWGVLGLILAYPMIVSLKIILEHVEQTKGWAVLMSEE